MKTNFWSIVNQAKLNAKYLEDRVNQLKKLLMTLSTEEVIEFNNAYWQKMADAYRWDLWGVARAIRGGCTDDGFHYFCAFLISEGKDIYNKALRDPYTLADIHIEEGSSLEEFNYVADEVYEEKTGEVLPPCPGNFPEVPAGKSWDEIDLDQMFLKVSERILNRQRQAGPRRTKGLDKS